MLFDAVLGLLIAVVFVYNESVAADSWLEQRKSHKLQLLTSESFKQVAQLSDGADQLELFKSELLKPFLRVRVPGSEGSRLVREHIKQQMTNLGWHVDEDMFVNKTPIGDKTFVNVIATHSPSIARRLTLACHYDSKLMTEAEFIGATDSAVPCAMMIDLARHLNASLAQSPDRDIALQFMFFDGEEAFEKWTDSDSLYGSRHLASKMLDTTVSIGDGLTVTQVKTIDALLLLDLIGSYDTKFANWFSATEHLYRRLQQIENELYDSHLLDSPEHNHYFTGNMYQSMEFYGGIQDDHVPFHQKGVPVVHLISYPFPSVWHKPSDNETALHYPTIRDIGKILRVFVTEYLGLVV